jgi:hypothetical protein
MSRAIDKAFDTHVGSYGGGYGVYMPDEGGVHVIPEFGREHDQTSQCWCHPEVEVHEDDCLVIHNVPH